MTPDELLTHRGRLQEMLVEILFAADEPPLVLTARLREVQRLVGVLKEEDAAGRTASPVPAPAPTDPVVPPAPAASTRPHHIRVTVPDRVGLSSPDPGACAPPRDRG